MIVLCLLINEVPGHAAERPNIVLIMCDDMGFSDIGCYGGEVATPNIDRLARDGMRFTQFYNNAKCTTTRASLITGLYPRRNGKLLKENMTTIAEVLRDGGYHTALSGKWQSGQHIPPIDRVTVDLTNTMGCWMAAAIFLIRRSRILNSRAVAFAGSGKMTSELRNFPPTFTRPMHFLTTLWT